MANIKNLFDAYNKGQLPNNTGYIITQVFSDTSAYTRMEIISYGNVKDIYRTEEGLTFQADGRKLYLLFEPVSYYEKHTDPCYRDDAHKIPYRFKELEIHSTKRQDKIMVGKQPVDTYTSFTILNPSTFNISHIISGDDRADIGETILAFLNESLVKNLKVPRTDAKAAMDILADVLPLVMAPYGIE